MILPQLGKYEIELRFYTLIRPLVEGPSSEGGRRADRGTRHGRLMPQGLRRATFSTLCKRDSTKETLCKAILSERQPSYCNDRGHEW